MCNSHGFILLYSYKNWLIIDLKDNILLILLCGYLIFCAVIAVYNYKIQSDYWFEIRKGYYEQCQFTNIGSMINYDSWIK